MITIGSLFTGSGALDMAVESVLGGVTKWRSDNDEAASKVITTHWGPWGNVGDCREVDWRRMPKVDVLTGGFPCQDVSAAGRRGGLIRRGSRANRSGLWAEMARAVDELRPQLMVAENVRGLLSAKTDPSAVLPCPSCVDAAGGDPSLGLRALGAVLGDLADIGYDAAWEVVRASDAGAPHQRARVFLLAWPAADAGGEAVGLRAGLRPGEPAALGGQRPDDRGVPAADTGGAGLEVGREQSARDELSAAGRGGADHRPELLPTPRATDGTKGGPNQRGSSGDVMLPSAVQPERWGKYAAAVQRWEGLTRPAPEPTRIGSRGGRRLNPRFAEWMMGWPAGHVTDPFIGLTPNQQLKLIGNGVVPQQAELALRRLLPHVGRVAAA